MMYMVKWVEAVVDVFKLIKVDVDAVKNKKNIAPSSHH